MYQPTTCDMVIQKLKRILTNDLSVAEMYYSVLSAVNNLRLTDREISLIAFTAVRGSINESKKEFCDIYKTTPATINNMISKLKKIYIFTRINNKVVVNPIIQLNFNKDVKLEISLIHRQANEPVSKKLPD